MHLAVYNILYVYIHTVRTAQTPGVRGSAFFFFAKSPSPRTMHNNYYNLYYTIREARATIYAELRRGYEGEIRLANIPAGEKRIVFISTRTFVSAMGFSPTRTYTCRICKCLLPIVHVAVQTELFVRRVFAR